MPRRKKLDITPVVEAFLAEIEFRVTRSLKEAVRDLERRLDRLEKRVAGKGGRATPARGYKTCRKPGCNGRVIAHHLCSRHYQQWRYHRKKSEHAAAKGAAGGKGTRAAKPPRPGKPKRTGARRGTPKRAPKAGTA